MVAPTIMLAWQSVSGADGFTLDYIYALGGGTFRSAAYNSVMLSVASATVGVVCGGAIAAVVFHRKAPPVLGAIATSFSAVAANFAGVPLAFAFIASLGMSGLLTRALKALGIDIYATGFTLYSLGGLTIIYAYFLIPLMVIIITPAIQALRVEWSEAAESLGATPWQYLRLVVVPILAPSLVSAFILLFGSAFSGYATAYALTSGNLLLLTTEIGNVLSGDVMNSPQTGAALSVSMIAVMVGVVAASNLFMRRARRWQS
ncbi:ABC transporter permease subunit [Mesorhizobium sp. STM 4661]|uniref:ABC transporter permease n=1 Tax=Mesorhizobium sp. STM 4661 TaxID=1297570 RepID=UPI0002BED3BA|nr:ABC transporter permease subunit [Mesorhizobium sp. STM 4661]CCV14046.1 Binding-protein-dependent transport systems inner membrane component [Mesorhizobium sp. STM 4661]